MSENSQNERPGSVESRFSERTHSCINLRQLLKEESIVADIQDSVLLLKNTEDSTCQFLVLDKLNQTPLYLELIAKLRQSGHRPEVIWVNNEEMAQVAWKFDAGQEDEQPEDEASLQGKVKDLLARAVAVGASDMHLYVSDHYFRVWFRVDGIRRPFHEFDDSASNGRRLIQSMFNTMCAGQSTNTLSYTQSADARFREEFVTEFGLSTARVATRPGGDNRILVVVRLISKRKESLALDSLGMTPQQIASVRRAARKITGIIVANGPTGHGKSTLLQCLAEMTLRDDPGIHLITVEDPVESPIFGAIQTPLMEEWPEAIRNLLRLDPDTIYYGEARDAESVYGVIEAAQTGHEVLTTTHTTWPIDVLQRWKRFGVDESYLTDPTLITCLVGIRLTPLLCPECKQPYSGHRASIDPEIEEIITRYTRPEGLFSRNPAGCPACKFTGVRGRTGVFEVIETDRKFMSLYQHEGKFVAWQYWKQKGNTSLAENLIRLINDGRVDPVMGHSKVCNLDRDETFNEPN
ncbi:pilus assembly protein PilQ [Salmonella enterica]|nr:pilus assembly protein PilQ [Salmonella enterica]